MIYMRWTGFGWLSPVLTVIFLFASIYVGVLLTGSDSIAAAALVGAGLMALSAPLHWLLGLALNSEQTPSGRRWHDQHTNFGMPMQYGFGPQLALALVIGSVALGQLTSPLYGWLLLSGVPLIVLIGYALLDKQRHLGPVSTWVILYILVALVIGAVRVGQLTTPLYGWLLFGGALLVALVGYLTIFGQRQLRSVADRKVFAAERGWLYKDRGDSLGLRWQDLFGKKVAYSMGPFGVLAGEVDGLPFTAFDSQPGGSETRRTYWAIHLPVAYPRVQVQAQWPRDFQQFQSATSEDLSAETVDAEFGKALLTPQVRSTTVASGLVGWRIEGRDLILVRGRARPHTANEIAEVATRLAELVRQLPSDLADRFGAPTSTSIPLRVETDVVR